MYRRNEAYNRASGQVFENMPAGGYVIGIVGVLETESKSHKPMLEIKIDIADGNFKYHFTNRQKNSANGKWSPSGKTYVMIPADDANEGDPTLNRFKAFMNTLEACNPQRNFWAPDGSLMTNAMRGALLGSVWGEEEYMSGNGNIYASTRINSIITLDDLKQGKFTVPERKKYVPDKGIPQAEFMTDAPQQVGMNDGFAPVDPAIINDQDIPF